MGADRRRVKPENNPDRGATLPTSILGKGGGGEVGGGRGVGGGVVVGGTGGGAPGRLVPGGYSPPSWSTEGLELWTLPPLSQLR